MKPVWILVADNSDARIFSAESSAAELVEIETLVHPEARMSAQEMVSDSPGKIKSKAGHGEGANSSYEAKNSPKSLEEMGFAKRVAQHLCDELNQNKFEQLYVIAAPSFLGDLRNSFTSRLEKQVVFTLDKNIVGLTPKEIRSYLPLSLA